jgi:hypothetical protein
VPIVVAYGDEPLHVFADTEAGERAAASVYTVAVGANLDAEIFRLTEDRLSRALGDLPDVPVVDHRR